MDKFTAYIITRFSSLKIVLFYFIIYYLGIKTVHEAIVIKYSHQINFSKPEITIANKEQLIQIIGKMTF